MPTRPYHPTTQPCPGHTYSRHTIPPPPTIQREEEHRKATMTDTTAALIYLLGVLGAATGGTITLLGVILSGYIARKSR